MSYRIPAVHMRGGTSKGVFFRGEDLPQNPCRRDALLRMIGSPDPYGKQTDGMGGATSSTSKVVIIRASSRAGFDVDYLFGQVALDKPLIDWSGNCGNLSAAVGPFAIERGLVPSPADGVATIRIWQANTASRIDAHVPVAGGQVVEQGSFALAGVPTPGAEIRLDFFGPERSEQQQRGMFPTGTVRSTLAVPGVGELDVTLICAGIPTIFVHAAALGLRGNEMQAEINGDAEFLTRCEQIRANGAVAMGLASTAEDATVLQPHTPKLAFVGSPLTYVASDGRQVVASAIDLNARIISMGKLHHAMTGTGAIAIAAAAAIPGTVVSECIASGRSPHERCDDLTRTICFGHPSGVTRIAAEVECVNGEWRMVKTSISRTARTLMEGSVVVPEDYFN